MDTAAWRKAIKYCADPDRARLALERLSRCGIEAELESASPTIAGFAAALFAASEAGTDLLVAHPDCWAAIFDEERLEFPRHEQGLRRDVGEWLEPALKALDYAGALRRLREFKQRDQLRIAVRDLARKGDAAEITRELSNLADICLATVFQICWRQLTERLGTPYHQDVEGDWTATPFTVIGLGKLGGQELNYSSDVDVMFLYGEEGTVFREPPGRKSDPDRSMTNHTFFKRLAETIVAEVARPAAEGQLFRIDVRLRPEGDAGPLVRSLASYENYYAQWGQVWERMMLIKARGVAGDVELAHEFLEMINPFRYPRSLNEGVVREIAAMKERIEVEVVKAGELERNVKLGRGGIREIEFIAQMHQLLHAGRLPFLQGTQTLPTLRNLVRYYLLPGAEAEALAAAYLFLRDTEHRIQMDQHRQSHTLPASKAARERIARLMGCPALAQFDKRLKAHTSFVHRTYKRFFRGESRAGEGQLPADFQEARSAWEQLLGEHGFREPTQAVRLLQGFVHGPGFVHVSPHTERLARGLIGRFLALCPSTALLGRIGKPDVRVLSDPDRVITRIDAFVTAYGTRAGLFETWTRNPKLFELLLLLFDRSEFLAETAIRHPDLVDDLVLSGWLRRRKDAGIILEELRRGMTDKDQHRWLRRYHRSEQMRIGLREILGLMNHDEVMEVLSALGEACLQYGLETVTRRHRLKSAPFAVIGLGKLGGRELNYGSDLDVLFVAPAKSRRLPRLQKIAADLIDLLSSRTEDGTVLKVDARLRPDGEAGLLVNSLDAYEAYYRQRAQLWEIQSLTRVRMVAGDPATGESFCQLANRLADFSGVDSAQPVAAFVPEWKREVVRMRERIEKERTQAGKDDLAIKTGRGGLVDAEFLAQVFCLEKGWQEPNTLEALKRAATAGALAKTDGKRLIDGFRALQRVEGILRRWSYEGETVLPDQEAPYRRVAIRCGFPDAQTFRKHIAGIRTDIRKVWDDFTNRSPAADRQPTA